MSCADKEKCFTFTWEIENFEIFLYAEAGPTCRMSSPAWKTETREGKAVFWQVVATNRGSSIEFEQICLSETFSPCTWKPTVIPSCGKINPMDRFLNYGFPSSYFVNKDEFFNLKKSNNSLNYDTFECKMLSNSIKSGGFRIHSVVKKVSFCWCHEDPVRLISICPPYFHAKIIEKDNMRINMILESEGDQYYICALALPIIDGCFSFVDCNVWEWREATEPNRVVKYSHLRTEYREKWRIVEKSGATRNASCKFNLQLHTIIAHHSNNQYQITHPASSRTVKTRGKSEAVNDPLKDLRLHKEGILSESDVTINTEGGETTSLNYAADKYDVQPLKQKCADILKAGLTVDNVCDALVLADTHSDEHLIKSIVDFINDHQEVVSSPAWQQLEESKPRLVVKITKELFLKRVNK